MHVSKTASCCVAFLVLHQVTGFTFEINRIQAIKPVCSDDERVVFDVFAKLQNCWTDLIRLLSENYWSTVIQQIAHIHDQLNSTVGCDLNDFIRMHEIFQMKQMDIAKVSRNEYYFKFDSCLGYTEDELDFLNTFKRKSEEYSCFTPDTLPYLNQKIQFKASTKQCQKYTQNYYGTCFTNIFEIREALKQIQIVRLETYLNSKCPHNSNLISQAHILNWRLAKFLHTILHQFAPKLHVDLYDLTTRSLSVVNRIFCNDLHVGTVQTFHEFLQMQQNVSNTLSQLQMDETICSIMDRSKTCLERKTNLTETFEKRIQLLEFKPNPKCVQEACFSLTNQRDLIREFFAGDPSSFDDCNQDQVNVFEQFLASLKDPANCKNTINTKIYTKTKISVDQYLNQYCFSLENLCTRLKSSFLLIFVVGLGVQCL